MRAALCEAQHTTVRGARIGRLLAAANGGCVTRLTASLTVTTRLTVGSAPAGQLPVPLLQISPLTMGHAVIRRPNIFVQPTTNHEVTTDFADLELHRLLDLPGDLAHAISIGSRDAGAVSF